MVDETLKQPYGITYWEYKNEKGDYLFNKELRDKVGGRLANDNTRRFTRWIDATLIEQLVDILRNQSLYTKHFKPFFAQYFPTDFAIAASRDYLKFILEHCIEVRNRLAHANPISVRQAEQVTCYSNDLIDSIKDYYAVMSQAMDFNAPSIISYSDSLGKKVYPKETGDAIIRYNRERKFRVGDKIRLKIEIDASFNRDSYSIMWVKNAGDIIGSEDEIEIEFGESWIGELMVAKARVISNKTWHRFTGYDDEIGVLFTVLPPLE